MQKGDSFWLIAYNLSYTMSKLKWVNNKRRYSLIHPGEILWLPEE